MMENRNVFPFMEEHALFSACFVMSAHGNVYLLFGSKLFPIHKTRLILLRKCDVSASKNWKLWHTKIKRKEAPCKVLPQLQFTVDTTILNKGKQRVYSQVYLSFGLNSVHLFNCLVHIYCGRLGEKALDFKCLKRYPRFLPGFLRLI